MVKSIIPTFIFLGLTICSFADLPDSIRITDRCFSRSFPYLESYSYEYVLVKKENEYKTYRVYSEINEKGKKLLSRKREFIKNIAAQEVEQVIYELEDSNYRTLELGNFGYSKEWLENNRDTLWGWVKDRYRHWTDIQKQFVISELVKFSNYDKALRRSILGEGYITISRHGGSNFILKFYYPDNTETVTASDNLFGFPWQTESHDIFNINLPQIVSKIIPDSKSFNKERFKKASPDIMDMLAWQVYDDECESEVRKLAPLAFSKELSELEPYFTIVNSEEYPYHGRYIDPDSQTFRITLKNDLMKTNVYLQYFISRNGNTLYVRDSLIKKYKSIISRIQAIGFLMDFLDSDTLRKIEIGFFDNRAFNDYNIRGFNKTDSEWAEYDKAVKLDPDEIEFRELFCGCNFRFKDGYLKEAVFFELTDEYDNSSIWVLLPDETPVLWFFEGEKAYKYSYRDFKTEGVSVQYACQKFDTGGKFIKQKRRPQGKLQR